MLMGRAFDLTGSYSMFLTGLAVLMLGSAALTLLLPRYSNPLESVAAHGPSGELATKTP